ncbi:type I glyceraldehyde-3-phosphate dehydrogenase [bacterium CG10_46_32]|nr:MAG: type I glyceraldehyde-3-phosphate dehydrogenase [bacterium CG10_46_32]PIR55728.1 MAG: type I glyceraldehyde-3-phosphate dehydrogenase [Parcubacteria group bacterium CG10_big_fil_rev_8_21_14_0_10_46_32]
MEHKKEKIKRRVAINGFGRIGRAAAKIALEKNDIELVAINDLVDPKMLAYLLKYDTVYGTYKKEISASDKKPLKSSDCKGSLRIGDAVIPILAQKDPEKLPWKELKVDVVLESTGFFTTTEKANAHLKAGAKRVIISAPAKDEETATNVISVNTLDGVAHKIVSNASCTTNCIAPVTKIIQDAFGIEKGMITTIHSYTSTQNLVDGPSKDFRRARAAAYNIIPTSTGAAIATTKTIPSLSGKFDAIALRVPTIDGSLSDFTFVLKKDTSVEEVNKLFREQSEKYPYKHIVAVTDEPLVSSDIIGNPHSAIVDLEFTRVVGGNLLKVLAWYDNEWGYANRFVEMVSHLTI